MKKIFREELIFIQKNAERKRKHEIRRKKKKKRMKRENQKQKVSARRGKVFKSIECPEDFSFINNPNELIKYFWGYKNLFQEWYWGNFDLRNVHNLSFDALSLLMVKIHDYRFTKGKTTKWRFPSAEKLNNLVVKSWFLKHVNTPMSLIEDLSWSMHWHNTKKQYDTKIWADVTDEILSHTFGWCWEEQIWEKQSIYPIIIECMLNTQEHAWKWFNWWLTYYKDEKNITKICFVDVWEWILKTLNAKTAKLKAKDRLLLLFNDSNPFILKSLLGGAITSLDKSSATEKKERWRWLPSMKEFTKKSFVKNFTIITNDVYANVSSDDYKSLDKSFEGTFIYREIHPI